MKITDVNVRRYGQMGRVVEVYVGREILVVSVATDEGVTGLGYVTVNVSPYGPSGDLAATLIRRNFRNMLLGEDPRLVEQLWRRMYDAIWRTGRRGLGLQCLGAIDCALWDIRGKLQDLPISSLLGCSRELIPTYANAAHQLPPDKLAEKAAEYVKAGHRALKIRGTATAVSLTEATERVKAVREAIGPDVKLMVDVNGTWDAPTAIEQLKRWEPYDVYWLEEPVHPEDVPGYVSVRRRSGKTLIVGGEQHATLFEFRHLLESGAVDIVQPNVNVTGGITEWLRIYGFATSLNVPVSPWNLQQVHIHMAAGLPNVKWIEYFTSDRNDILNTIFEGADMTEVVRDDGVYLRPPEGPGLGLNLNEAAAEQYMVKE